MIERETQDRKRTQGYNEKHKIERETQNMTRNLEYNEKPRI